MLRKTCLIFYRFAVVVTVVFDTVKQNFVVCQFIAKELKYDLHHDKRLYIFVLQ